MLSLLLVKWFSTTLVAIGVSVAVVRLGPRIGGVLAGTPIVLGPGYFYMLREQPLTFVADAALGSLHAMLATLAFCLSYVLLAGRWGALASVALAAALWVPVAATAALLPGGVGAGRDRAGHDTDAAFDEFTGACAQCGIAPLHWGDLLIRAALAGAIVCLATVVLDDIAPAVSGVALSFPIGMPTIALTLHQRYGVEVARATLADTQIGMLSLVAFSAVLASSVESLASALVFGLSLVVSLLVSTLLWFLHRIRPVTAPFR